MFDEDITIINRYIDDEHKPQYKLSYIKGFWCSNSGITINGTQLTKNDGLSARILIKDNRNEHYQSPHEFEKEQKTWTLQNDDYLVKGKVENFITIKDLLEKKGQDVMKITDIAVKNYGSEDMWHFAVTGA